MAQGPTYAELAITPAHRMSMGLALSWQAAQDPDRPAITMGDVRYSRMELDRQANRCARMLAERGVGLGDRVALLLKTGPLHHIATFALWKLGATVIPLPWQLAEAELAQIVAAANPKLVIGCETGRLPDCDTLPADFLIDMRLSDDPLPEILSPVWKAITSGGSTGIPKLLWDNQPACIHPAEPMPMLMVERNDCVLHPAPAYHNAPFCHVNWSLCWGVHVVLMARFDALEWLALVERHHIRWSYLVPTMMKRILDLPRPVRERHDITSLEVVMHMAAPCPDWVKAAWIDWLGAERIYEIYGGTEGYGVTLLTGQEWLEHRGSVGRAPPGTRIVDEDGKPLSIGEIGLIQFVVEAGDGERGARYESYGDMGRLDDDGYLYLADRRTDMILTGGANLYPAEIEAAIEQYPGVVAAAVIGLPDPDMGALPHAIIELRPGARQPSEQDLKDHLQSRLAPTKHPRSVEFVAGPLRDGAGKMRRSRLRAERLIT